MEFEVVFTVAGYGDVFSMTAPTSPPELQPADIHMGVFEMPSSTGCCECCNFIIATKSVVKDWNKLTWPKVLKRLNLTEIPTGRLLITVPFALLEAIGSKTPKN